MGEDGIISKAQLAKHKNKVGTVQEKVDLWNQSKLLDSKGAMSEDELLEGLKKDKLVLEEEIDVNDRNIIMGEDIVSYGEPYNYLKEAGYVKFLVGENKKTIKRIVFNDTKNEEAYNSATYKWDLSDLTREKEETVIGWIDAENTFHIEADGMPTIHEQSEAMFWQYTALESIDVSKANFSRVYKLNAFFNGCSFLKNIDMSNKKFDNLVEIYSFASGCESLETVNFSGSQMPKVTITARMFADLDVLNKVDMSNMNLANLENVSAMFANCAGLKEVNFNNANINNLKIMDAMFFKCKTLKNVNFANTKLDKLESLSSTFEECLELEKIDLSTFNFDNVTDLSSCFYVCKALKNVDFSGKNLSNVTNMSELFRICTSLEKVDLSNTNLSNVTTMSEMLVTTTNLKEINLSNNDLSKVTDISTIINGASSLLKKIDFSNCKLPVHMSYLFSKLTMIANLDEMDFSNSDFTKNTNIYIRSYYNSLKKLDMSNIKIADNTELSFYWVERVADLKIDGLDFSKLTPSSGKELFYRCESLETMDLSNFDLSQQITLEKMFDSCYSLKELKITNMDLTNVENISQMLVHCTSLEVIDFSGTEFSDALIFEQLLLGSNKIKTIKVKSQDIADRIKNENQYGTVSNIVFEIVE